MAPRPKNASRTIKKRITISQAKPEGVAKTVARKKRDVKWPLLAQGLYEWYHGQDGSIPDSSIRLRAKEIFEACYQDAELPKFSDAWVKSWKVRYADYYDEQMLVAASKKLVLNEPEIGVGEPSTTMSADRRAATAIEPSNETRITKFVKVTSTARTSSNELVGSVNSEERRNHEAHNSHGIPSTYAETHIAIGVSLVCRSFNQTATEIDSYNQSQSNDRDGRTGSAALWVHRDEIIAPASNDAGKDGSESLHSTRVIGSVSRSGTPSKNRQGTDGSAGIGMDKDNFQTASLVGGDEAEDPARTQLIISQPEPTIISQGLQSRVLSQVPEPHAAPRTTTVNNQNGELDPRLVITEVASDAGSLASTVIITSRSNFFVPRNSGLVGASSSVPNPNELLGRTETISGEENGTGSLASTVLIPSRSGSPAAPRRGERAFGTWAFDVGQQEAPSFNIPSYDEAEGLEDTFIINSPSSPAVVRPPGAGAFGTWAFDVEVQDAPEFIWPEFPDDESLASTVIIDY